MLDDRFLSNVEVMPNGCWRWTAGCSGDGYPAFNIVVAGSRKVVRAHRYAYETEVRPIPAGLVADHLCRNIKCVNPRHVEPVTNRENIIRGVGPARIGAFHAAKTHCPFGHEYSEQNTLRTNGQRQCRACNRNRMRQRRDARRAVRTVEGTHQK